MMKPIFEPLKLRVEVEVRIDVHPQVSRVSIAAYDNIIG
jgi:hypothetical protein